MLLHLLHVIGLHPLLVEVIFFKVVFSFNLLFSDYRLTFWLSNSIVLRTIISQATGDPELPKSARSSIDRNGAAKVKHKASSPLKWEAPSSGKKQGMNLLNGSFGDWENPNSFMSTLEKIESWIFSRIVESIWWQVIECLLYLFFLVDLVCTICGIN